MAAPTLLRIYLNDHLAGATAGLAVARRCLARNEQGPLGDFLRLFVRELEQDRTTLKEAMRLLGAPQNPLKQAAGLLAERVGLLKFNGQLTGYSDLSRLLELEALSVGVEGKLSLWRSLSATVASDDRLAPIDLDRLIERARAQREGLEEHRLAAAGRALAAR